LREGKEVKASKLGEIEIVQNKGLIKNEKLQTGFHSQKIFSLWGTIHDLDIFGLIWVIIRK
jgi:hypothetical protein